jgi:formylglycine-generating enzyme required for sulfatase activity/lipoprotein NlpI
MKRLLWLACVSLAVPSLLSTEEPKKPSDTKQITNSIGMKLTLVPSGEFMMGSKESAEETAKFFSKAYGGLGSFDFFNDEHPQHRVQITRSFYLGTFHVTRGQFRQFVADTGYKTDAEKGEKPGAWGWDPAKKGGFAFNEKYSWRYVGFEQTDEHPVVNLSWNDAAAFCKWLSKKEGNMYRLPTEAEWEHACRAGTTTRYYCGDDPETLAKVGNVADATFKARFPNVKCTIKATDSYVFTSPVGSFKPNAFGIYDMHGNAWQWCADRYDAEYYAKSPIDDPTGPDFGDVRVSRGGSWNYGPRDSRSAERVRSEPNNRSNITGFRVVRTAASADAATEAYEKGKTCLDKKDYDAAISAFAEAIRLDPTNAEAYCGRGLAYGQKGEPDKAIADCTEAIRLDPKDALAYVYRGMAYGRMGNYDKVISDCTEAIRLDPKRALACTIRGAAYMAKGDFGKAISDCNEAIRLNPDDGSLYFGRGDVYARGGEHDKAIADYTEAIRLIPKNAYAYYHRGIAFEQKGEKAKAEEDFAQAKKLGYKKK